MEGVKNLTTKRKSAAELTEVSPVMLHCSNVVSSTTISPSKGLNEGAVLQLTAERRHKRFHISTSILLPAFNTK